MTKLPVSALVPTYNSATTALAHVQSMRHWADLVEEIVVVDSQSTDGTIELLKAHLHHPKLQFLSPPRGLYLSWNAGIQALRGKYTYISTQGDTITPEGLRHLVTCAEELSCDAVISRPELIAQDGAPVTGQPWPIHKYVAWRGVTRPARVESWHMFLLTLLDVPESPLGSSASNLYRTETLQRHPFPTDYGHAGDAAWGIQHAFDISVAVTSEIFSEFVLHPKPAGSGPNDKRLLAEHLFDLARQTIGKLSAQASPNAVPEGVLPLLRELPPELQRLRELQYRYDSARHAGLPWLLNPSAWRARLLRNRQRQVVQRLKARICEHPSFGPGKELWTECDT
jgi:hypothetical protein